MQLQGVPDLSRYGDVYELGFGLGRDCPPTSALIKNHLQRKIIYQMTPIEVIYIFIHSFPIYIQVINNGIKKYIIT